MIVDTSALIAIVRNESDSPSFETALELTVGSIKMSAASYLEAGIVIDGMDSVALSARLDDYVAQIGISIVSVTESHARTARRAYQRYGKGRRHPAQLNFGDCFAYALAFESGEPLLFKGNDFTHTDIESAMS